MLLEGTYKAAVVEKIRSYIEILPLALLGQNDGKTQPISAHSLFYPHPNSHY
ncbi:MAG: hypothetical protein ACJAYF_002485 [Arenicella sp.]|jgi:hypothetical protein